MARATEKRDTISVRVPDVIAGIALAHDVPIDSGEEIDAEALTADETSPIALRVEAEVTRKGLVARKATRVDLLGLPFHPQNWTRFDDPYSQLIQTQDSALSTIEDEGRFMVPAGPFDGSDEYLDLSGDARGTLVGTLNTGVALGGPSGELVLSASEGATESAVWMFEVGIEEDCYGETIRHDVPVWVADDAVCSLDGDVDSLQSVLESRKLDLIGSRARMRVHRLGGFVVLDELELVEGVATSE